MSRRSSGLQAWVVQRVSAIYLALLFPYLILHFLCAAPADIEAWRGWIAQPLISLALALGLVSLLLHAWVGVRDIFFDYVHPFGLRLSLLVLTAFGLLACGLWGLQILFLTHL
jgi:succinate dehydrogenase / fumarate reductase membrane anchor subunit